MFKMIKKFFDFCSQKSRKANAKCEYLEMQKYLKTFSDTEGGVRIPYHAGKGCEHCVLAA